MDLVFGLILAVLVIIAVLRLRRRNAERGGTGGLSDDEIRRIEEDGTLEQDEPLDFDAIDREHRKYFEETWDEPEEF